MGNIITVEKVRSLYDYTMDDLKMEQLSEATILTRVDVMLIIF